MNKQSQSLYIDYTLYYYDKYYMRWMMKIILYHGTSQRNAEKVMKDGFIPDKTYNWNVKSKKGFVYLSSAYSSFYAMSNGARKLALIKVEVDSKHLYPEDDFVMLVLDKKTYT